MARGVYRVDHRIKSRVEDFRSGFLIEEGRDHGHAAHRMDGTRAVGHGLSLLAADLAIHRVELAVHVAHADFIQIHQGQIAYP